MQKHHSRYEIQAKEHGDGEDGVHGHQSPGGGSILGLGSRPPEAVGSRNGMHGTYHNFDRELNCSSPGDGDTPVFHTIVHSEQLQKIIIE